MSFQINAGANSWQSRKGCERAENRDACGVLITPSQTVAIVADSTEHGSRGVAFVTHLITQVLCFAKSRADITPESLLEAMRAAHKELRALGYLHEKAAYAVLVLKPDTGTAWAINCGDCRVGRVAADGKLQWLTPVHTGANALGEEFSMDHATTEERHLLTRRLRVTRFDEPAITPLELTRCQTWVMATDGFWIEYLWLGGDQNRLEDDASVLSLTLPPSDFVQQTDCSNFSSGLPLNRGVVR